MDYNERVDEQIKQFANKEALIGLPKIYRYWNQKYVVPKIKNVFGFNSIYAIYADEFIKSCQLSGAETGKILSIGCGDGTIDVAIAKTMINNGYENFKIIATELSDIRINRAKALVTKEGLDKFFEFLVVDVNEWNPSESFQGVIAQHTLHHIVELERLFSFINNHLHKDGAFVVVDMIGKNGHMRWPESLQVINRFWKILPDKYKFNHQFKKLMLEYVNWDCSNKGFEGIRAQDILPLLQEHFNISHFVGVGGFIDVFVERGFGHNFDPESEEDLAWIDTMAIMNDSLLLSGEIKPTIMYGICKKKTINDKPQVCYENYTSGRATRNVDL